MKNNNTNIQSIVSNHLKLIFMRIKYIVLMLSILPMASWAQSNAPTSFTLQDCLDYALANSISVQNSILDEESAKAKVKETVGIGLPQISGNISAQKSPTQQRFFSQYQPGSTFGVTDAQAAALGINAGDVYAAQNFFQLKGSGDASLSINQLIFNGSYIVGIQASNAYKELAVKQSNKTKGDISADVAKSYFNVLINKDRLELFTVNLARLDTLYRNTLAMNENGFAERIEVDRLKVALNNLKSEQENIKNLNILSMKLLKFQMSYPLDQPLELEGKIEDVLGRVLEPMNDELSYMNRPDYQVLMANQKLQELNLKNKYAEALPSIGAFANMGYSTQSPSFGGLFSTQSDFSAVAGLGPDKWYGYSTVGLRLSWSLFTGLQRNYQIQQQKIELEKIENNVDQFENMIQMEVVESGLTLNNALEKLSVQQENKELAERIYQISQIKYQEGVGSNLEVVDADSALKEAQTNYYNALFEAIIAKIDLSMALGLNKK
jgi:outer membrane protein